MQQNQESLDKTFFILFTCIHKYACTYYLRIFALIAYGVTDKQSSGAIDNIIMYVCDDVHHLNMKFHTLGTRFVRVGMRERLYDRM